MRIIRLIYPHSYTIQVPCWKSPGRFRLAVLSDLHNNLYPGLLKLLQEAEPDWVLIIGDFINRPTRRTPPRFTRGYGCAAKLAERFPVYYAPGNHESTWANDASARPCYARYREALSKKGVVFLENSSVELGDPLHRIRLSGLELGKDQFTHHWSRRIAPTGEQLRELLGDPASYQILLAHHPDFLESYAAWGADLVLSGHLHGGQVRLPGIGGLVAPGFHFFPPYTKGLYESGNTRMIVSAGLGTHTIPIRPFNPREALLVDLVKEEDREEAAAPKKG